MHWSRLYISLLKRMCFQRFAMQYCVSWLLLVWTTTGLACMSGGLTIDDLMTVPQSNTHPAMANKQWIFPSLHFTCTINVTAWAFTVRATDVVCPTLELWTENKFTSISTDYAQTHLLTPTDFKQPESLSESVYRCTLLTPVVVSAGTVLGFQTRSQNYSNIIPTSNVQLLGSASPDKFYNRIIELASTIINTNTAQESSGSQPLLVPVFTPEVESSSSTSKPTLIFPLHPPTSQSTPPLSTSIPTQVSNNPTPVIVASVATTVVLLLVAVAVLTFVMVVLTRQKKQISSEPHTKIKEEGQTKATLHKNNYIFTTSHIYEDVDSMSLQRKKQQHDYDYITSMSIKLSDRPKSYEVPQTNSNMLSSTTHSSSQYEVPGHIVDEYKKQTVRTGSHHVEDSTYDTPMDTQISLERNTQGGEAGYDIPVDPQESFGGRAEIEKSICNTLDTRAGGLETSVIYEDVGSGEDSQENTYPDVKDPGPLTLYSYRL